MADGLTVVVPTRDRPELLRRCLTALRAELTDGDRLVVVDSSPARHPARPVAEPFGAEVLLAGEPGTSLARNLGWRAATTEQVAFVDDDVLVAPGWRAALLRSDADFVLGGVDEHPDDSPRERPVSVVERTAAVPVDREGPLDPGIAGNLRVRRTVLADVGGFDERLGPASFFASAEDLDLFDRMVAAGHVGWYEPSALAWHVQWRDERQSLRLHWAYGKGMGARLARLARTDRRRARLLLPQVLRLGGVATAVTEVRSGQRRHWGPPVVWRLGALAGFVVAVARRL
ncbi:MAG: glycosyltransferase [Streptomyces sp.]|uniref:glycosyltransferase family 2 protein n=1 Tax=Streptomyces sp. TaxID=1931 RepID=UPI0025F7B88B|nr:glycosyltransferase [Streptomyces sp.]MBW8801352.1 glycosyltransferase [Streptomyces sp.]